MLLREIHIGGLGTSSVEIRGSLMWDCGGIGGTNYVGTGAEAQFRRDAAIWTNRFVDHEITGIPWVPSTSSPAATGSAMPTPDFVHTDYVGAFEPGAPSWVAGWGRFYTD